MRSLGPGKKPVVVPWYPHMGPEDAAVWTRFLERGGHGFEAVWYDVHVGMAVDVPEGSPDWLLRVAAGVTRKRIDVVARRGGLYLIIEVKPYANQLALGQAIVYVRLFYKEFASLGPARACIVCDQVDGDVGPIASEMGVLVFSNEYVPKQS